VKETREIDLNTLVDVPTSDGGTVKKRLVELTSADLQALADQHRSREVQADLQSREQAASERQNRLDPHHKD
jgi:hypothetical protein